MLDPTSNFELSGGGPDTTKNFEDRGSEGYSQPDLGALPNQPHARSGSCSEAHWASLDYRHFRKDIIPYNEDLAATRRTLV